MSFSDCARCWDTPCTCPGSACALAKVASKLGYQTADASSDTTGIERLLADARALWAVRVLDAWADSVKGRHLGWDVYVTPEGKFQVMPRDYGEYYGEFMGASPFGESVFVERDAARLAAAESVFPELPEAARAKLGTRP